MNRRLNNEENRLNHLEKVMIDHKRNFLNKMDFSSISKDEYIKERFLRMLIDCEAESCLFATDFIEYFGIYDIDKWAIIENLELFSKEYLYEKENSFCVENSDF